MNVLHVTPAYHPAHIYGGPIESVYQLCRHLGELGCLVKVLTTDANGSSTVLKVDTKNAVSIGKNLIVRYCPRIWPHSVSPALLATLPTYIREADVVHLTSVYSFPTLPTLAICKRLGKPVVWSPRGSFQRWDDTTRLWAKRIWGSVCRVLIDRRTCVMHATSEEEDRSNASCLPDVGTVVIPNGIEVPEALSKRQWMPLGRLRLLYLGRLHPIKGIENLIRAVDLIDDLHVTLCIYGNGNESYRLRLQALVRDLNLETQVSFHERIEGTEKQRAFMHADVCIVPSFSENFGLVVAEALAHGVPVVAGRGTPWRRLEEQGCGLWVENTPTALSEAIRKMQSVSLRTLGESGRVWMQQEYTWPSVAKRMSDLYRNMVHR